VLTVDGAGATALYLDGAEVQRGPRGTITPPAMPWHVMRNGTTTQYARGRADEVAVYDTALSPDAIHAHFEAGRDVGDTTAPAPPTGLRATARLGRIQLDWSNVSAPDLDGYDVYRSTDPAGPFTRVNPSRLSTSEYVDGTVTGGVASTYIVAASDEANNRSAFSEPVTATPLTTTDLLRRYAPQLRFELQESYFADSAAEMTDNFVPGQRQNVLVRADGTRLAAANPADPLANLSLGYLGDPRYADGRPARETDFINAANRTYQRDVQRLRAAGYGDRVYGRALTAGGKTWLQYWRFSYYNPQNVVGYGVHEGDWEFTQIGLDADGTPDVATYGQHAKAERCPWGSVQKTGGVPVVYVALASHASYFSAGVNRRGALPDDDHRGRGYRVRPALEVVTQATPLMAWRGRWGASKASPKAPRRQAKWGAPNSYNAAALPCTIRSGPAVGAPRGGPSVPAPSLDVARSGDRVVVRYAFQRLDGRLTLVVSVARQDAPDVAAARRVRVRRETGVAALDLPAGASGRYVVSASAFDAEGGRSDVVRALVR
jgi:hypothetical protein